MTMILTAGKRFTFFYAVIAMVMSWVMLVPDVASATLSEPAQFVQKLGDTALMSLTSKSAPRAQREKRVRDILTRNFDLNAIGKFALGTYWREATPAQQSEYLRLFEDMVVQTYTTRFEDYSGQSLKVEGSTSVSEKDFVVDSKVIQEDGPPVALEWRVRMKDGGLKVVDVIVEGISMSVTQRSDFSAVIQRGGGGVDALLVSLRDRKKTAAAK